MKQVVLIGQTDYSVLVFIPDPAQTDGSGKTGLVAANLTVSYTRVETDNDVTVTDVTSSLNNLAALTTAHTDWGLLEVSSTLAPGLYRLDIADAVFASGAWSAVVYVMITTSAAAPSPMEFMLSTAETTAEIADAVLDDQIGDGTITARQALRIMVAALSGKLSGAETTTITIRNVADSANVVVATVDSNGNRTATTVTP